MSDQVVDIYRLRDNLADTLVRWQLQYLDRLWRSKPDRGVGANISFSCSALAIQALMESGRYKEARIGATKIANVMLRDEGFQPLPGEMPGLDYHTINNAWALFILLEVCPDRTIELREAIKWLIDMQHEGEWAFIPDKPEDAGFVKSSFITAYALITIAQYCQNECDSRFITEEEKDLALLGRAQEALQKGYDAILERQIQRNEDDDEPTLWAFRDGDTIPHFGVTVLCMHAIDKIERTLKRRRLSREVRRTFNKLADSFDPSTGSFNLGDGIENPDIWDGCHFGPNYYYSIYPPLCITTLSKYITATNAKKYNTLINFFVDTIINGMPENTEGKSGTYANVGSRDITVWSTASALVAISRLCALTSQQKIKLARDKKFNVNGEVAHGREEYARNIELAIYCPLVEELEQIERVLDIQEDRETGYYFPTNGNGNFLVYTGMYMGRVHAALATIGLLNKFRPEKIIVAGIAGGFREKNINCGDIIIPRRVVDISARKIQEYIENKATKIAWRFRPDSLPLDDSLIRFRESQRFRRAYENWRVDLKRVLEIHGDNEAPRIHHDRMEILCAEEVVASDEWVKTLVDQWPRAAGIETESGGVCEAAKMQNVPVCIVRGVSDHAGANKADDDFRWRAMRGVSFFVKSYVDAGDE